MPADEQKSINRAAWLAIISSTISLHDRVIKIGVSFLRGIITSSDLSDMHVISMNVILPPRRREG